MKLSEKLAYLFVFLYTIPSLIFFLIRKNYEFVGYVGILIIIFLGLYFLQRKVNFDPLLIWLISIWGAIHMAGGAAIINGLGLYKHMIFEIVNRGGEFMILKYDQFAHFYVYLVVAMMVFFLLRKKFKKNSQTSLFIFTILAAIGIGSLNEIVEFLMVVFIPETWVGGYENTLLDLCFNTLGAITGTFLAYFRYRNS
jgi:uncharacterized membrane protein YjdF